MKKSIAPRKLKRTCIYCNHTFCKGEVYYKERKVIAEGDEIIAYEYLVCPKCKYQHMQHEKRFNKFCDGCKHPIKQEIWSYIPGEYIKQPDHLECLICGKKV